MAKRPGPVLVTGANSGFGLATLLELARRGWEAWGTARSGEKAAHVLEAAAAAGLEERVHPLVLDVSDHGAIEEAFGELPDFYGVVNNAGYSELGAIEEVSADEARAELDVNLITPAIVSACALPGMRRLHGGRIVMVSSIAGLATVMPLNGWYHASKFGLEALSDVLRMEVAGFGVKVSIIEPGFFRTGITTAAHEEVESREHASSLYKPAYQRASEILRQIIRLSPPPDAVAGRIVDVIESRNPPRRALIGLDAHAIAAANRIVPRNVLDATVRFLTGLDQTR